MTEPEAIAEIKEIRVTLEYAAHEAHTGLQDHMDHEEIKEIRVTLAYEAYEDHVDPQDLQDRKDHEVSQMTASRE